MTVEELEARRDELKKAALEKGKDGNATPSALQAQKDLIQLSGGSYIRKGNHCRSKRLSDEWPSWD